METDPKITQMLELVNRDFKITIINTLKNPQEKTRVSKTQGMLGNMYENYMK